MRPDILNNGYRPGTKLLFAVIGLFSRQCLGKRRLASLKILKAESRAWNRRMNRNRVQIAWKFDRKAARKKFGYNCKYFKRSQT